MKKRALSLLLLLSFVIGMMPMTFAGAAVSTDHFMAVVGESANCGGDAVKLTLQLQNPDTQGGQTVVLAFDPNKLELMYKDGTEVVAPNANLSSALDATSDIYDLDAGLGRTDRPSPIAMYYKSGDMNLLVVTYTFMNAKTTFGGKLNNILSFNLRLKNGATASSLDLTSLRFASPEECIANNLAGAASANTASSGAFIYNRVQAGSKLDDTMGKPVITVDGNELKAGSTPLTSITVALGSDTLAVPTAAQKTATTTATATPNEGANLGTVAWSIDPAYAGVSVGNDGKVTVQPSAAAGTVTVKATSGSISGTKTLTLTKAAAAATSMTVSATDKTAVYGTAKDITPTFAVKDQYGAAMTGQTITMDAATGFSFDGTRITVANNATVGNHELTFKCGTASAKLTITVGKANGPAAPSITGENATVKNGNGKLKGTTADMEYSANNGTSWTTCSATETAVPAGTYIVRVKETATHKAGAATAAITITAPGTSATPTVKVTPAGPIELPEGGSQKLTAAVSGENVNAADCTYVWKKDGTLVAGQTTNELTVTEAGTYTCVVTHTHGSDDPAEGTSNAVVVTVKGKTVVTVAKKATASQTEGALDASKLVTVTGGTWNQVKDAVTATVYEYIPAVEDDPNTTEVDETKAAEYKVVTGNLEGGKTYYVDVNVAAITDKADYKVDAVAGVGAPANTTAPADLTGYVVLTVNKRSSGGGGGGSSTTKYTVTYDAGEHGKLDGSATERVESGKNPAKVPSVVADKGYKFVGWTLNGKSVKPASTKITAATKFVAEYEAADKVTYIQGMDKNHFQPAGNATRGQLATMLARLSKDYDASKTYTGKAPDVENGKWYTNTVNFAINQGIMNGFEDGMFRPTENIRRGEFAAMLARYLGLNTSSKAHFADVTDHWAAGYINALADAGIVDGFEDGTFKAQNLLTRAEAVKMINLAVEMKYDEKADYDNSFVDVAKGAWYYEFVMPAANLDVTDYQR